MTGGHVNDRPIVKGEGASQGWETMVVRMWKALSTADRVGEYIRHARETVFPRIHAIEGNRGEYLLCRDVKDGVELVVLTLWESMEAVRRFAGPDPNLAVVEPEARAFLSSFDEYVTHYEWVRGV
jgi:heme-degrading monooxygenase HmoA